MRAKCESVPEEALALSCLTLAIATVESEQVEHERGCDRFLPNPISLPKCLQWLELAVSVARSQEQLLGLLCGLRDSST